jgi:hypothetical protein
VKHLVILSTQRPAEAKLWQEIACSLTVALQSLFEFAGGGFPFTDFIVEKCDVPVEEQ